jgi:NADH:ubiquinone reductase (H+-translocating)
MGRQKVVVIGGGFGGIAVAKQLKRAPVDLTIIDRQNHHLFQPLLYQVGTAGLSPANIAWPIRSIFRRQKNIRVVMGDVEAIDVGAKIVKYRGTEEPYDVLVVATGVMHGWFGHPEWAEFAIGLKELSEATEIRNRILEEFERAETDGVEKITLVVIGGGPTGVEMAGSIAELAQRILPDDFRTFDPEKTEILLIEAGNRLLNAFNEELGKQALHDLQKMGVTVMLGQPVTKIDESGVEVGDRRIESRVVVWAAGVAGTPAGKWLNAPVDRQGRVLVDGHCQVPFMPDVYVIGDVAAFKGSDGTMLPGVASVAIQQGEFVGRRILGSDSGTFVYHDPGSMATIGRSKAVVERGNLRLTGLVAWLAWLFVHLIKLMGSRNRVMVFIQWVYSYLSYQRGARLIFRSGRDN